MSKQVDKSHYAFSRYMHKRRWASVWHQMNEVVSFNPDRVLEVGPGPGVLKSTLNLFGVRVETVDIDPELNPDHVCSVLDLPFEDCEFDVVCAFQMLEHLPFEESVIAFSEMSRVARKAVILSLPDATRRIPLVIHMPKLCDLRIFFPKFWMKKKENHFDGEHYWEVNKNGYTYDAVRQKFSLKSKFSNFRTFNVPEYPYHRFFVFYSEKYF